MAELRDSIYFGKEDIPSLFKRMLLPTLFGMVFSAMFFITDGIFVGRGVGSNALAAVNFVSPLTLISVGLGLMYGIGSSIVCSIHLASQKLKVARINMTQATVISSLVLVLISSFVLIYPETVLGIFGCDDPNLLALSTEYIRGYGWFMTFNGFIITGGFFVRLNGAPRYAMMCSIVSALLNILLDYVFIFPLGMGIFGAALATGIGTTVGVAMMIIFLLNKKRTVHLVPLKITKKSLALTARNIGYMSKLGISSFLGHFSIAIMIVSGNMVFLRLMGADGVAAYSVIGYISPLVFTLYNAIAQSAQPILSYNFGAGDLGRVRKTLRVAMGTAVVYATVAMILIFIFNPWIISLFIAPGSNAYDLAVDGFPFYAMVLIPCAVNIIAISYFQSVKQATNATIITIMRGYVLMVGCYAVVPRLLGNTGAWLSTPLAETITMCIVILLFVLNARRSRS